MDKFVEVDSTELVLNKDDSSERYITQIEFTNVLCDKVVLTKIYFNSLMNYTVRPSLLIMKPREKGVIKIIRNNDQLVIEDKDDKIISISIPVDNEINDINEAKVLFKNSDYKIHGQKIHYKITYPIHYNVMKTQRKLVTKKDIDKKQLLIYKLKNRIFEAKTGEVPNEMREELEEEINDNEAIREERNDNNTLKEEQNKSEILSEEQKDVNNVTHKKSSFPIKLSFCVLGVGLLLGIIIILLYYVI